MWFKNLRIFRLLPSWSCTADSLEQALEKQAFRPGGSQDMQSLGWVPPREGGPLVHALDGQYLLSLRAEKKLLPATVINQFTKIRAQEIEEQQGYKPGRKHAAATSDDVIALLAKALEPFPIVPLYVEMSPASAMTNWLVSNEPPAGFTIDQDTELRSTNESRAVVRYVRHSIDIEEVRKHVESGKQCTRLALTWADRVSFVLTEGLEVKRVTPLDVLKENQDGNAQNEAEEFDSDFTLMAGELAQMLDDLVEALGGEKKA